jgi:methionyl-tRNA formyltransferase
MKVAFCGYRKWAFNILDFLSKEKNKNWKISGVITTKNPETDFKISGKDLFEINPKKNKELINAIEKISADVLLFYGWSWMVPKEVLKKAKCVCLHPSPLPKYRGGSPIQHQIINGEKNSAVSLFFMTNEIDDGNIIEQEEFSLKGSLEEIFSRIEKLGKKLSVKALNKLSSEKVKAVPQNENKATIFKRRKPEESELKPEDFKKKPAEEICNFIRALDDPYPNAFIVCADGKRIFLKKAELERDKR